MTRWVSLVALLLLSAFTGLAAAADGWIALFDGKNLDQWVQDGTANFQIADGSIMAVDKKDPKAVAAYLISKQSYKDFELRAEFWVSPDANSGIFIRCTDRANISSKSAYEANIFDTRPEWDGGTGALGPAAKVTQRFKSGGQWNTYVIVAKGPKMTLTLNGVKTVDVEDSRFGEGPIALQFGQGVVMFRKIEIKPL